MGMKTDELIVVIKSIIRDDLEVPIPIERLQYIYAELTESHDTNGLDFASFKAMTNIHVPAEFGLPMDEVFAYYDHNNNLFLSLEEYLSCFQFFGMISVLEEEHFDVGAIFELIDIDESGVIEKEEFLTFCNETSKAVAHFHQQTKMHDIDGEKLWHELDNDGSGELDFEEWVLGFFLRGKKHEYSILITR